MRVIGDIERKARPKPNAKPMNIIEFCKNIDGKGKRREQYSQFVKDLNQYLKKRYRYKTDPVEEQMNRSIDASRAAFRLYLRFKPDNLKYSLVVANATFRPENILAMNILVETQELFVFLLEQSKKCKFNEVRLERWCGIPEMIIEVYGFNRIEGEDGWQISCDELERVISKSFPRQGLPCI